MCLIVFAYKTHPEFPLVIVANRDEFYGRTTRPAHFWASHPQVFAGRDLDSKEQGTWMGINNNGRFAAVTNFREMDLNEAASMRSRGELTANFLCADTPVATYLDQVAQQAQHYKGFNLLLWENNALFYLSNRIDKHLRLEPGIYGLSNGALDTPWPKVKLAKIALQRHLSQAFSAESLLALLADRNPASDHELPNTGIDIESERLLSSCFIHSEHYGTRATTVLLIHKNGKMTFLEQNWNAAGVAAEKHFLQHQTDV